jgi:thioredoxin reductase (NADPH)
MAHAFSIEEVLQMAQRIETNGRKFYLAAAAISPDNRDWLTELADQEVVHERLFGEMAKRYAQPEPRLDDTYDPDGVAAAYLHTIADTVTFKMGEEEALTGSETIEDIIEDAIRREHEAILFYTGIKDAVSEPDIKKQIGKVIGEEMGHVTWLQDKRLGLRSKSAATSQDRVHDLIIIGAGPAGVSMAAEAITAGMSAERILILEGATRNSWIIRRLYPEQKLVVANYKGKTRESLGVMKMRNMSKQSTLHMLNETMNELDMQVLFGTPVTSVAKEGDLFVIKSRNKTFKGKFCVLAIGVFGEPNRPDYPIPPVLRPKTLFDVTTTLIRGQNVLVVGGGDSASEYVQYLKGEGNEVTLSSREDDLVYMNDDNRRIIQDYAKNGEITLYAGNNIRALEPDLNKIKVVFESNKPRPILVDRIVYALGGTRPTNFIDVQGMDLSVEPSLSDGYETEISGLYMVGDLGTGRGGGAIATAFTSSFYAMKDIAKKLKL